MQMIQWDMRRSFALGGLFALCVTAVAEARDPSVDCQAQQFDISSLYDWPSKQNVFFVQSSGFIADRTFMAVSVANGPSAPAKALASWLTIAESCPLQITVAENTKGDKRRVRSYWQGGFGCFGVYVRGVCSGRARCGEIGACGRRDIPHAAQVGRIKRSHGGGLGRAMLGKMSAVEQLPGECDQWSYGRHD